ncbi:MAG: SAM-dependent methyltransferase [Elusimicrobiota bacterium]|jgi:23S rRNA (cytidine2498-2'-O)-methyltransferase
MSTFHVGQKGFEAFLAKEAGAPVEKGEGWALSSSGKIDLCFAHLSLAEPVEVRADTVNALAGRIADYFLETSRNERYESAWPLCFEASGQTGLGARAKTVEEVFREKTSRLARVMKLAERGRPGPGARRGLFACLTDFNRAFVSRQAFCGGQRRMADDPQAPSRSFLKVEEAYLVLGAAPQAGERVVDLGAAPGGWSYSAARREAGVTAVDNGPLKGGALGHPLIRALAEDAFRFQPALPVDWLFCDVLEDPRKVLELLRRWVEQGACRRFVVNLKFGRQDPLPLLREAFSQQTGIAGRCKVLRARHLYHDREELTLVGELE